MSTTPTSTLSSQASWGGNASPFALSYGKIMMWFFLVSDALTFGGFLASLAYARHFYHGAWPIGEEVFHSLPFLTGDYPLIYVAIMTFILIISSVTMVLAVEAGHRNHQRGVIQWMAATVLGGLIFLGSQAWEWSHFIHGSTYGKVLLADGSLAVVQAIGEGEHAQIQALKIVEAGGTYTLNQKIEGETAKNLYFERAKNPDNIIKGARLDANEYGPQAYGNYFFFITGFHGLHVFSGVILNLLVLIFSIQGRFKRVGHYEMVEKVGLYWHFVDLVWVFVFTFFYLI